MKKFSVNPISVLVWIWLFVIFGWIYALNYVLVITLHESGHYVIAKMLGYKLSKFALSPYGVSLSYYDIDIDKQDEFWIALAGPATNIVSITFMLGVWWMFPSSYFLLQSFVEISLVIALFNLLPAYPLDGGRIFVCLLQKVISEKRAQKITIIFNFILSIFFVCCFAVSCFFQVNPTLMLFAFFMICGMFDLKQKSMYEKINVLFKHTKNFAKMTLYYVNLDTSISELVTKMKTSQTCVFCLVLDNGKVINLSEKFVQKLLNNYTINTKLSEIIKNTNK